MALVPAARAALVTVAVAAATLLGAQIAQADDPTGAGTGVTAPQATPSPTATATTDTNPWD